MNDELFWSEDSYIISHIAGAIRKDLENLERTTWVELWGISISKPLSKPV